MLSVKNLEVSLENMKIIKGVDLEIEKNQIIVIMGPNGSGKSTLAKTIMGHPFYKPTGDVKYFGKDLFSMGVDERAKAGILLTFQEPPEVGGVSVVKMMSKIGDKKKHIMKVKMDMEKEAEEIGMKKDLLMRDLNVGFSGGEKKRVEMLQINHLKPKLVILDEIDSGLDVDGMNKLKTIVDGVLERNGSVILITHQTRLFNYIKPNKLYIMNHGKIAASGGLELAQKIERDGYKWISKQ